jgi:chromate transport protein ChrA
VVGLIGAAAVILVVRTTWTGCVPELSIVRENFVDWKSWCLLGAAFVASYWGKVNPILVILAAAVLGLLLY